MQDNNFKKAHFTGAILFLGFLLIIFILGAVISFPRIAVPIEKEGIPSEPRTCKLSNYEVLDEFDEYNFYYCRFYPSTYYYFKVLVRPEAGEEFIKICKNTPTSTGSGMNC